MASLAACTRVCGEGSSAEDAFVVFVAVNGVAVEAGALIVWVCQ
jgi:hypothetical protein